MWNRKNLAPIPKNKIELKIGHYAIGENLGNGKFGIVKFGYHRLTNHTVAIKIVSRKMVKGLEIVDKVSREMVVLYHLHHPHVVKLYQTINTPTDIFLILEYVDSFDLFNYICRNHHLSEDFARKLFQQIVSGVSYCHRHKVIHRDLKLENLLLDHNLNIKIADFGLSNILKDGDLMKTSCGSPNYAAPEIVSGWIYFGPEVDVWSLGIILYVMLSGSLPFDDKNLTALFERIKLGVFVFPETVPEGAREIIVGSLKLDPHHRITIEDICEDVWFKENTPPYLFDQFTDFASNIDHNCVKNVADLFKIDPNRVLEALKSQNHSNPISAAYRLVISEHSDAPLYKSPIKITKQANTPIASFITEDITPREAYVRRKWHMGIRANGDPIVVMNKVYSKLLKFRYEWKIIRPFSLEARRKNSDGKYCYFGLSLYKREEEEYLLDIYMIKTPIPTNSSAFFEKEKEEISILTSDREQNINKKEKICNSMEFLTMCDQLIVELSC